MTLLYLHRVQITAISKSLSPLQRLPPAAFPAGLDGVAVAWPGAVRTTVPRQDDLWACRRRVQGGWVFVCLLVCSPVFLREETVSKRNLFWQSSAFGASLGFSSQLCPLMEGNVRGLLMTFFLEFLLSQAQGLNGRSLTIKKSCLISVNLCAYKGRKQQDFTSLSALKVVMRDDGSLGTSCAASCRKLGDYWKSTSWELLGSSTQDKKDESSFQESIKGVRVAEREQRKAKGLLQGQKEVIIYVSKWEVEEGRIDDPAVKPGSSACSFLRTVYFSFCYSIAFQARENDL